MKNFLDKAERIHGQLMHQNFKDAFADVFRARDELQAIYSKSDLDIDNIETLFGIIEMAQVVGRFINRDEKNIANLRKSIVTLITETLEHSIQFPTSERGLFPPHPYGEFVDMVIELGDYNSSFITFNYDLALDFALYSRRVRYDYHFSETLKDPHYPLLKLHGSINWRGCKNCNDIKEYAIKPALFQNIHKKKSVTLQLEQLAQGFQRECPKCRQETQSAIVPPTWNKTWYSKEL